MVSHVVTGFTLLSLLILDVGGQFPGTIGNACRPGLVCLDNRQHVCDTNDSPPKCKIKTGHGCGRQPDMCVLGASCINDICDCNLADQGDGLCQQEQTVTESNAETSTMATEETSSDVTAPVTMTTTEMTPTTSMITGTANAINFSLLSLATQAILSVAATSVLLCPGVFL